MNIEKIVAPEDTGDLSELRARAIDVTNDSERSDMNFEPFGIAFVAMPEMSMAVLANRTARPFDEPQFVSTA